jgi:prenyltransferase beta subunit
MKLWEKLSGNIFRLLAAPYQKAFREKSLENVLKRSLNVLDAPAIESLRNYIENSQAPGGGFIDKAGKPDLYYTLFGYFMVDALEMKEILPSISAFVEKEIRGNKLTGVHLHCAAILSARLGYHELIMQFLWDKIQDNLKAQLEKQPAYNAFLNLLTCYYLQDYRGLYKIRKQMKAFESKTALPCSVLSALLVLQKSFKKPVKDLIEEVLSFRLEYGGFKATKVAPIPDLLSTAVALYALNFAGYDLSTIKPQSFEFIDSLYVDGGFGGNVFDSDPDIEYTFYGLLALGALA